MPQHTTPLRATTAKEQIIVYLIIGGCFGAVKDRGGSSLQADDDGAVCCIGEDVPAQAVGLPAEVFGVVEAMAYFGPAAVGGGAGVRHVGV